jgi:protein-L-isoaspartate(D-aspartate) O-methyltransferase
VSVALRLKNSLPDDPEAKRLGAAAFVLSLRERGVFAVNVLRAMELVPRDHFAPRRFADLSRSDVALPLACGQTMTSPASVAAMLAALDVKPGHRVLEIGTGSGYVSALLARMGADVQSVERYAVLAEGAESRLSVTGLGSAVAIACGDGLAEPWPEFRFDRILLNGATLTIGANLTSRLVGGGKLVGALASEGTPRLLTISREDDGRLYRTLGSPVRIPPLAAGLSGAFRAAPATDS